MARTQIPKVATTTHRLAYFSDDGNFDLRIPIIDGAEVSIVNSEAFEKALNLHLNFRLEIEKTLPIEKTCRKAKLEIDAIRVTFPGLQEPAIIAAMVASFSLLCIIDDVVEHMSLHKGKRLLQEIIDSLSECRNYSSYAQATSQHWMISEVFCKEYLNKSSDMAPQDQIRSVVASFRRHTRLMLPTKTWVDCCGTISDILFAVMEEHEYRAHKQSDLCEYLRIRARTIGVEPFFRLLQSTMDDLSHDCVDDLMHLEQALGLISGLQNDIVGVEKDVRTGEWMNYAKIASSRANPQGDAGSSSMNTIALGVKRAVDTHNSAVALAIEHWEAIVARGNQQDIQVATTMLSFAGRHYLWASTAKRYRSGP